MTRLTRDDYDVWKCAGCGRLHIQASVPHRTPTCCGTGMFWDHFIPGRPYQVDIEVELHRQRRGDV